MDIVALSITPTSDGIVRVPDTGNRSSAFAVAAVNAGSTGDVTVTTDTNGVSVPAVITICQTNTTTGACLANPAPSISLTIAAGETPSFGVFVQATDAIAADTANNRILVRFSNNNQSKGATSVAIQSP